MGLPVYATCVLGSSAAASRQTVDNAIADGTALPADGWYFAFEFQEDRIPSSADAVKRCLGAALALACTGLPVLHAYAGPMSLLSAAVGAGAVGVGHSQNLWQFTPARWSPPTVGGGGGDAPPRFFSSALWGTIIYPDEIALLPTAIAERILTTTQFSSQLRATPPFPAWSRWDANKHLVNVVCEMVGQQARHDDAAQAAQGALQVLDEAVELHERIEDQGVELADQTNSYQANWARAMRETLAERSGEYDYLALLN